MSVVFYISGHGFGHASRQIEIINVLGLRRPDLPITIRTSARRWLFDLTLKVPVSFHDLECDTGIAQIDSLQLNEAETIRRADAFHRDLDRKAECEARELRNTDARLVIADIPPLGPIAAARASIPAIAIGNFTWDWIYEGYPDRLQEAPDLVPTIQRAYRCATEAWRLPLHGGFTSFDTVRDVPFIARRSARDPREVRTVLGLPVEVPLALLSFGGYGLRNLNLQAIASGKVGVVVTNGVTREPLISASGPTLFGLHEQTLYGLGLRYEDLVAAVDVVITKPGFGIIAECVANRTAVLYTSRGRFREYDVLVAGMPRYLRCRFLPQEDLLAGRWQPYLEAVLAQPSPPQRPRIDGADVIADMILERLDGLDSQLP